MEGPDIHDETYKGIIPRTVEALFSGVSQADENIEFTFKVSYIEIYCEKVDCLGLIRCFYSYFLFIFIRLVRCVIY